MPLSYDIIFIVNTTSRKFWILSSLENAAVQLKDGLDRYLSPDRLKSENINGPKKATVTVLTKDPVINADPQSIQFLVGQVCDWQFICKREKTFSAAITLL